MAIRCSCSSGTCSRSCVITAFTAALRCSLSALLPSSGLKKIGTSPSWVVARANRVGSEALLPHSPLRTGRESFPLIRLKPLQGIFQYPASLLLTSGGAPARDNRNGEEADSTWCQFLHTHEEAGDTDAIRSPS